MPRMSDTDERRAGSVILNDLALFNKAAILYEDKIEPAISTVVSDLVRDWLEKCGWKGEVDFGDLSFWVCPNKWKEENVVPIAKFTFTSRPGVKTRSYNLADVCGIGQADWGFQFEVGYSWFDGKNAWVTRVKDMAGLVDEVVKKGWTIVGKGVFFRPMKLPAELLADAWESENWSKFLKPLEQALNALSDDQAVFDEIITTAKSKI
jgi:hypothetical protein